MQIASIELYELLKNKIGEKEAKTLVTFIETEVENKLEHKKDVLATKEDIAALKVGMERRFTEQFKWMFIFIVGQTTVTIGVMIAVLQLFFK